MDLPASGADVLAQPTRARVFSHLVELRRGAGTGEIAERLELHPNGVRRHLERLREEGLVTRERVRDGRGRPRDRWLVSPSAHPGGEHPKAYGDLAVWLAMAIPATRPRLRELERAGREIGRDLAPRPVEAPVDAFRAALAALGFEPELSVEAGAVRCRLANCPYRAAVARNAEAVCRLHRGITAGLLEAIDPDARLTAFEPADPERAGCRIEVSGGSIGASR